MALITVHTEKELMEHKLDDVAMKLFGKPAQRQFPIYLVFHRGKFAGYFHTVQQLCVYPAIHPEYMRVHDYVHVVSSLVTEFKRMAGNPVFMLCTKAEELGEELMSAMRLKKAPEVAYLYYNIEEED